jgi:hypothetical protein
MNEVNRQRKIAELTAEMLDWAEGRKSHWNEVLTACPDPERRTEAFATCAGADAAEVQKLSAAIQALAALDRRPQ